MNEASSDNTSQGANQASEGRYAFDGLDRVFHERARLGIMTALVANPAGMLFPELRTTCDLTDGNLNRHLKTLAEQGLIAVHKSGAGRGQQTRVLITESGRQGFLEYVAALEAVVRDATHAAQTSLVLTTRRGRAPASA